VQRKTSTPRKCCKQAQQTSQIRQNAERIHMALPVLTAMYVRSRVMCPAAIDRRPSPSPVSLQQQQQQQAQQQQAQQQQQQQQQLLNQLAGYQEGRLLSAYHISNILSFKLCRVAWCHCAE